MTLAVPMLGDGGGPGGWEGQGQPPPLLQAALVCEVATRPASLLPAGPLFGLSACLAALGVRRSPLAQHPPGASLLMELGGDRPSPGPQGCAGGKKRSQEGPLFLIPRPPPLPMKEDVLEQGVQKVPEAATGPGGAQACLSGTQMATSLFSSLAAPLTQVGHPHPLWC